MLDFITFGTEKLQIFLMIIFRATGVFVTAPIIGNKSIPNLVKVGLAVVLAMVLMPMAAQSAMPRVDSIWLLALMVMKETLVGMIIGMFFSMLFLGVRVSGDIIGFQTGMMMASVMDPESNSNVSIVGEFWFIVATLIFLVIDGHHAIISALNDSYKLVPLGYFNFSGGAGELLIKYSSYVFVIGIKLAAPVIVALFLTTVALGIVARTAPQMNIFIVGIPINIGVGFLVMAASLPIFRFLIIKMTQFLDHEVRVILESIGTV